MLKIQWLHLSFYRIKKTIHRNQQSALFSQSKKISCIFIVGSKIIVYLLGDNL